MNHDYNLHTNRNFSYYVGMLNIEEDSNVLIISPVHHYYYNFNEIKNIRTLIYMKELNRITDLKTFMNNTLHVLSLDSKFIGCFKDNKIYKNIFYRSKILYWLLHCLDGKFIYRSMSRAKVIKIFSKLKMEILDMSEIDGITYFCVKKS